MTSRADIAMRPCQRPPLLALLPLLALPGLACLNPPPAQTTALPPMTPAPSASTPMPELDAWTASKQMSPGINIGNTLENTSTWETGWGNPPITREFVQSLAALGFKSVRVPVAWDTYAVEGRIQPDKMARVAEVAGWIIEANMFSVINIHWDGGWIDSGPKEKFPATHHTFSAEAEQKFKSYWQQIASHFAGQSEKLIFESLNEETNFSNAGSEQKAYETLTHVNQLFIDTVRQTGGNNAQRLLIVAGYSTDIEKTCDRGYELPRDTTPGKLFISVHYYTPWQFCGMTEDADWGKVMHTWGTPEDVKQLNTLFDKMSAFTTQHDLPAFIGEFNVTEKKESASRIRWMTSVANAAHSRGMIPVLWDTGHEVSRRPPHTPSPELEHMLQSLQNSTR